MHTPQAVARLMQWTADRCDDRLSRPQRMAALLERIAPDCNRLSIVKVAGTNGKGSVCAMLAACLQATGRSVGLFASPHLVSVCERIRVNGTDIDPDVLDEAARRIEPIMREIVRDRGQQYTPYFFEAMLLIALRHFLDNGVHYAIIEAGIGGGRDATSLQPGRLSAITSISFDHESVLGDSLKLIATDKALIAQPGSTLVIGAGIGNDVIEMIRDAVASRNVRMVVASRAGIETAARTLHGSRLRLPTAEGSIEVALPLCGEQQIENFATVASLLRELSTSEGFPMGPALQGVSRARWSGRFEHVEGVPDWLLDGAHNEEAIRALIAGIELHFRSRRKTLVYGASKDKRIDRYEPLLSRISTDVIVTDDFHHARPREAVARELQGIPSIQLWAGTIDELVAFLRRRADIRDALIVVTGSLFLVGNVRRALGLGAS